MPHKACGGGLAPDSRSSTGRRDPLDALEGHHAWWLLR